MKKILMLMMSFIFAFQIHVGATAFVSKSDDPFEGDYSVDTSDQIAPFEYIGFTKKVYPSYKKYEMKIIKPSYSYRKYYIKSVQLKVDNEIYDLKILKQEKYSVDTDKISFISEIPVNATEAIKNANQIMIRVVDSDDIKNIVEFPAESIIDWKDVVNTEK